MKSCVSTITAATAYKPISMKCAETIAEALEGDFDEFFKVDDKEVPLSDKTVLEHHRLISTILVQAAKEMIVMYAQEKRLPWYDRRFLILVSGCA